VLSRICVAARRSWRRRQARGARGERRAARWLRAAGFTIIGRGLRVAGTEIDLLTLDPDGRTLVLIEVKTRRHLPDAKPSVLLAAQQHRLRRAMHHLRRRMHGSRAVRFDLILVTARGPWRHWPLDHIRRAPLGEIHGARPHDA